LRKDGIGVAGRRRLQHGVQCGPGIFGIEVDFTAGERLVRDERSAEIDLPLDLEAGALERGGVHFAEDELLGEILRPDAHGLRRRSRREPADQCRDGDRKHRAWCKTSLHEFPLPAPRWGRL
jgi:hypothetical protein